MNRIIFAALFGAGICSAQASAADAAPLKVELVWEGMDGQAWTPYFLLNAVQKRLPPGALDIKIAYLANKDEKGAWKAKGGQEELDELMRMAVIQDLYPKQFWNYLAGRSLNPWGDGWKEAVGFAGISTAKLADGVKNNGANLLEKHWKSLQQRKDEKSPLFIEGKPYKGDWRLLSLTEAVNSLLPKTQQISMPAAPKISASAPPKLWVITSKADTFAGEDNNITAALSKNFQGMKAETVEYDSAEFKSRFGGLNVKFLPAYVIEDVPAVRDVFNAYISRGLFTQTTGYLMLSERSREGILLKQTKTPGTLELFVMAQCPYGVQAENLIVEAVSKKLIPDNVKIRLRFIADVIEEEGKEKKFQSLHGPAEWEEDVRQLMIQEKYPDKFFAYLSARNAEPGSSLWEEAAKKAGIDPAVIIAEFDKGKALLEADAKIVSELGINSSPTFLWEGRTLVSGVAGLQKIKGFEKVPAQGQASGGCQGKK